MSGAAGARRSTAAELSPPSPVAAALGGLCPRCGARTLYAGTLRFADRCAACGLDIASFNVGDGPAAFLTLGLGTLLSILAIATELVFAPPWWVHLVWLPVALGLVIGSLRLAKAALLSLEYRNAAGEGRTR